MSIATSLSSAGKAIRKAAPRLLTFVGVGCTIKAVIASGKAGIEVCKALDGKDLTSKEKIAIAAPHFIEPAIYTVTGIVATLTSDAMDAKKIAALTAVAEAAVTAYSQQNEVIKKLLSGKKDEVEKAKVLQEIKEREHPYREEEIEYTGNGNTLFEDIFGRRFRSSVPAVANGINAVNSMILAQDYADLNELYYKWGIRSATCGWNITWSMEHTGMIDFDPENPGTWITINGEPCCVLQMSMPSVKFN